MKTKGFWVIKTSARGYWCSGNFDPQLRKAHVYTWKEKAEEMIEVMIKRKYLPSNITYEVVAISEPKELKDTEAEWISGVTGYICSACREQEATNRFRFCPNCGKRMINYTMLEDNE